MNRKLILALLLLLITASVKLPEASASQNYQPMGAAINRMDMDNQQIPNGATIQLEAKPTV